MFSFNFGFFNFEIDEFWRLLLFNFDDEFYVRMMFLELFYYLGFRVSDLGECLFLIVVVFDVVEVGLFFNIGVDFFGFSLYYGVELLGCFIVFIFIFI